MRRVAVEMVYFIDNAAGDCRHGARIKRISDMLELWRIFPTRSFGKLPRNSEDSWKVQAQRWTPDASIVGLCLA